MQLENRRSKGLCSGNHFCDGRVSSIQLALIAVRCIYNLCVLLCPVTPVIDGPIGSIMDTRPYIYGSIGGGPSSGPGQAIETSVRQVSLLKLPHVPETTSRQQPRTFGYRRIHAVCGAAFRVWWSASGCHVKLSHYK